MAEKPQKDVSPEKLDEERLGHALVSRGLMTREEVDASRPAPGEPMGQEAFLQRVVARGFLTLHQARRAAKELSTLMGQQIPGFLLMGKVGQGAMGIVYRAMQVSLNRIVAVKILHPKFAARQDLLANLTREAQVAARLSHNNIVQAIDVGSAGPLHYLVMEFVEGKTIKHELEVNKKRYEEKEAVEIVLQIAQALQHAHRRGLVHRDVKPANIVLTAEGIAKLADLGMARQQGDESHIRKERGLAIGTPFYMSPEQIRGKDDIDGRADIYALGATLYHMVTGQPPFSGNDVESVLRAHLKEELTPPDHLNQQLSSGLGEVVEYMLAKDRKQRYQKADDLIIDLECLLAGEPPKLVRKKIEASTLKGLEEGVDDQEDARQAKQAKMAWLGVMILGGLLLISAVVNLVLLLRF